MKAMIFAAGLGTRLKPYTLTMPKALVPVAGVPMIEILIKHLVSNGFQEIIINLHHFADQIVGFLKQNNNFGASIVFSQEEETLLDTGGGLKRASWFFDDKQAFLVQNVDVICDLDYRQMIDQHIQNEAIATLAVSRRVTARYLLFDAEMQLCGWENTMTNEKRIIRNQNRNLERFAFSGIHVIDPTLFEYMPQEGKFSIINTYLDIANGYKIVGFEHNPDYWVDMGKPEELLRAEKLYKAMQQIEPTKYK